MLEVQLILTMGFSTLDWIWDIFWSKLFCWFGKYTDIFWPDVFRKKRGVDLGLGRGYSASQVVLRIILRREDKFVSLYLSNILRPPATWWVFTRLNMPWGRAEDEGGDLSLSEAGNIIQLQIICHFDHLGEMSFNASIKVSVARCRGSYEWIYLHELFINIENN